MSDARPKFHGLTRWSVSRITKAQKDKTLLLLELKGIKGSVGVRAHGGTAVEAGVAAGLMDLSMPLSKAQEIALKEFDRLTVFNRFDGIDKERAGVPRMVEQALEELRPYGTPSHLQYRVEWQHPDLQLPFLGFADFYWEDHGIVVDLKTTNRMPSDATDDHQRQVASYCQAISDNLDGRVTYATTTKAATYQVTNMREHVETLVKIAKRLEWFLSQSDDIDELFAHCLPNYDLFYYDQQTRAAAKEIYGF